MQHRYRGYQKEVAMKTTLSGEGQAISRGFGLDLGRAWVTEGFFVYEQKLILLLVSVRAGASSII